MSRIYRKLIFTISPIAIFGTIMPLTFTSCGGGIASLELSDEQKATFGNTLDTALPQTSVYQPMLNWMNNSTSNHRLLFIGYDGARVDAMARLNPSTSAFYANAYSKPYFTNAGGNKRGDQQTKSNPGWCSILTGQWGKENGVRKNKGNKLKTDILPTTLSKKNYTASLNDLDWHWIWREQMQSSSVNYHENSDSNNFTYIKQLIANGTKAVFCIFNHTDATGEKYGFNPNNTEYMAAIHETDDRAKQLISQVQLRSSEDWMIVMTTDHGGKGKKHGGKTDAEIYTWLSCNKSIT